MKIDPIKILLTVIAIVLLIMVGSNIYYDEVVRPSRIRKLKNSADSYYFGRIADVIDRQTLRLQGGHTLRLLGCRVRDIEWFKSLRLKGQPVMVELPAVAEKGETMAGYVFLSVEARGLLEDAGMTPVRQFGSIIPSKLHDIFLNATLVRSGFADIDDLPPDSPYRNLFEPPGTVR
ncbi:MAG: hypothetical protein KC900_10150 [Candidatus Omnitrophica bacterium]|nr:hypothetical protein [Candidatus Omnitrophota bacterium]